MSSTLTITTIQTDLRWEDKAANLQCLEEKILAIREPTEIVILPEMFSTGFSMKPEGLAEKMDGPTMAWMKTTAAQKKIILTGSLIIEEEGNYYNRLIWMLPNGQYGFYDKRHRFAFAGENEHYTAGRRRLIASVKGWKVLPLVCYDLRFPVWSRQTPPAPTRAAETQHSDPPRTPIPGSHPNPTRIPIPESQPELTRTRDSSQTSPDPALEYDLLIYVANWPERRNHAWKTLLQARAIENQCFVAGINRIGNDGNNIYHSGDSMIIDPLGTPLYQGGREPATFTYTLWKEKLDEVRTRFPFWRDADHFSIEP